MPLPTGKLTAWVHRIWLDGGCRRRWYLQENRCAVRRGQLCSGEVAFTSTGICDKTSLVLCLVPGFFPAPAHFSPRCSDFSLFGGT